MSEPEAIVRALAVVDPIQEHGDYHWCVLCGADVPVKLGDHADDCPWRQAVEWVAAQYDGASDAR